MTLKVTKVLKVLKVPKVEHGNLQSSIFNLQFSIEDTGIGILPERLQNIFLPFHQVSNVQTVTEGTGLGLAISQQLAHMMGSELHVNSTVGQGTTLWFDIELPEVEHVIASTAKQSRPILGYKAISTAPSTDSGQDSGQARKILIVDDKEQNRAVLRAFLIPLRFEVMEAANGREALDTAKEQRPDLILMDLVMPIMDGFEATRQIRQIPELKNVIIIGISASAFETTKQESRVAGCHDFLVKPVQLEELLECLGHHLKLEWVYEEDIAGNESVVIYGESGAGKELVARTIHNLSERKAQKFVAVNCGAVPESLFEREFFGHRKGAFTGADRDKPGYFDQAHEGTLFLDEVGELEPTLQVKLLRVLQDGEYIPLGDTISKTVDVRIIAAINKDLTELLRRGVIRQDFFYRIRVTVINLPPFRERREDIPLLIDHFLEQYGSNNTCATLPSQIVTALCRYDWPGNIRELQNELQRYLTEQRLEFIGDVQAEPFEEEGFSVEGLNFKEAVEAFEKRLLTHVLAQNYWHQGKTAALLNIPPRTLYRKIRKYGLKRDKDSL